ncbi:MAG: 5-bromo-4-chloroindolyl phosphate hydrolysis family protein [Oscillospiraceae bacterium]|nr:5-bromo-4-chloroindolyl phosphate hydrolysis family protein [Oscillospiraceae bacterium]
MATIKKPSVAPIYLFALVWIIWGLFLPLYTTPQVILAAVVSIAVYFIARKCFRPRILVVLYPIPEPVSTGDEALDALIAERDRALSEMRRLNDSIQNETISAQIDHLEEMAGKIINHVVSHPEKLPQIRKFMTYYLPTTLKLLNAYDRMSDAGVAGANIDGTTGKIEVMMAQIVQAFDKQLDALFGTEALDISTDIAVLEQMLAREGIGGSQLGGDA